MESLILLLKHNPLLALFLTISLGYLVGKFRIRRFILGGIAGSLLVGVLIGQIGMTIPAGIGSIFFALFIYAVGYQGGPLFFRSLNKSTAIELVSAAVTCLLGLICVLVAAAWFKLDSGTASGLAAGALTQSAMIGTASSAIANLHLPPQITHTLQSNVAVGYAVCYIFGSFGPILLLATLFPALKKWDLREEAIKLAHQQDNHQLSANKEAVTTHIASNEETREIILTNKKFDQQKLQHLQNYLHQECHTSITITAVSHLGEKLTLSPDLVLSKGDDIAVTGETSELNKVSKQVGHSLPSGPITDFIFFAFGMALGVLLGMITFHIMGISITLGSGVGCLFSGLVFGWLRSTHPRFASLPVGASNFLRDFGLAVFVATIGITAGPQAINTIKHHGVQLFFLGIGVTLIPQIISFYFSYHILKIKNPIKLLATIAGGKSANPGFAALLDKAGNSTPVLPFTATYALANILLTLWGPIVVALVAKHTI